jgi:hypothetical protein
LTPHELRHIAASLAVAAGATVKSIQAMLGHAPAAMTLDVYGGLFDDDLDGVAERTGSSKAKSSTTPTSSPRSCKSGRITTTTTALTGL